MLHRLLITTARIGSRLYSSKPTSILNRRARTARMNIGNKLKVYKRTQAPQKHYLSTLATGTVVASVFWIAFFYLSDTFQKEKNPRDVEVDPGAIGSE